jgi:uroporphyrinogen III methyltransferase/synthase
VELPTIEIQPAADFGPLDRAIATLESYDWLVFTSANGVRYFLERLDAGAKDLRAVRGRICAIGPATRDALERFHLKVDLTAAEYVAEGLLRALKPFEMAGKRVLIARAAVARDVLPNELCARGADVEVVEAYRTVAPDGLADRLRGILARRPDWITFSSSSTVQNLVDAVGADALSKVQAASIGPVTSATLRKHGIAVGVEAATYTAPGLVDAILAAGKREGTGIIGS